MMEIDKEDFMNLNQNLSKIMEQLKRIADKLDEWTFEGCLSTYEQKRN